MDATFAAKRLQLGVRDWPRAMDLFADADLVQAIISDIKEIIKN